MIAHMNFATAIAPLDTELMAGFTNNLNKINRLAEESEGFIWRLMDESGNATAIDAMTDPKSLINVSVWRSVEDLYHFSYKTEHQKFVKNRVQWFLPTSRRSFALWSLAEDAPYPTAAEALERLAHLETHGPTDYAFDWASAKKWAKS